MPIFGGIYACVEGVLGIYRDLNTDGVIPAIDRTFLEFIPEDQWHTNIPKKLLSWEVKSGDRFRVVFTNYSNARVCLDILYVEPSAKHRVQQISVHANSSFTPICKLFANEI